MLDPTRKRFGYSQLGLVRICFPHPFQFRLSKEGPDHIAQNRPGSSLDGLAWPEFSQTHLVWKQAGVQESLALFLAGRNWPATSSPLSDLVPYFHRRPG